ncbi:uncharacterized protein LOC123909420 [Trifolium pratense]|uniref:uncharacterized protein LOC123909420 n=1 Tax=Trifolium pratense TaxID=57577 RepID=UPI001E69100F|nr:uncharacterized protein LOC123909420 [Trifolium pratense]
MDLTQTLRDKVLVERKGFAFLVNIEYENLPDFCTNCKVIGHYVANCKKLIPIDDGKFDKDTRDRRTTNKEPKKVFVPTKEGRQGQGTSKGIANVEKTNENNDELVIVETDKDLADRSLNPKPHDQQRDDSSNNGKDKEVANMNDQFNIIEATEETPVIEIESTKDTEGVEDTQVEVVLNKDEALRLETNAANKTTEFLNQSWANMVDAEEEELKTQEIAEHENLVSKTRSAPLPIVKSKTKAKNQKQVSSSSYGTRSKLTGNTKPVK